MRPRAWALGAVLAFATLTRLLYLAEYRAKDPYYAAHRSDAVYYDLWARSLATGAEFHPGPYYQAPLYPHLLAVLYRLFGLRYGVVYLFQLGLGVGTLFLVHRVAARLGGPRAGVLAAGAGALYGVLVFNETKLLTAPLLCFLLAALMDRLQVAAATDRTPDWIACGVVLGLAGLTNAGPLLLVGVLVPWVARPREGRRRRLLAFVGAAAFTVMPATVRNLVVGDDFVLVAASGGVTFVHGNSHESFVAGGSFGRIPGMSNNILTQREESRALAEDALHRSLRDSEVSSYWLRRGLRYIVENPGEYLRLQWRKATLILDSYEHSLEYNAQVDPNLARLLVPLPFGVVLGLACLRVFAGPVGRVEVPVLLVLFNQTLLLFAFHVSGRHRLTVVPPLLVLGGVGLADALLRDRRRLLLAAGVSASSLLLLRLALPGMYRMQESRALADRAAAYSAAGRWSEAGALLARALALEPAGLTPWHRDLARDVASKLRDPAR